MLQPGVDRADRVGFTRVQERAAGPIAQDSRHLVQEPRRGERVCTIAGSFHRIRDLLEQFRVPARPEARHRAHVRPVGHHPRSEELREKRRPRVTRDPRRKRPHRLAVAVGAQRGGGEARLGVDRRVRIREGAREGRGARVEEADDGGGVERAAGRAGRGFRRLPRVVRRVVAEILLGVVSLGLVARRVGVGRRNLAIVPRTARGSFQRPSQRAQAVRSRLVVAGVCDTGGRDRVRRVTGAD